MNSNGLTWDEVSNLDLVGFSEFQRLCCASLRQNISGLNFEESGSKEKYYLADVDRIDAMIYVYRSGAEITSSMIDERFEACDYDSPSRMIQSLVSKLADLGAT